MRGRPTVLAPSTPRTTASHALVAPLRLLLATLAAVLGLGVAVALPPAPAGAADGDLVIELTGITPAVLRTGDELTVTGRITNTTDSELATPAVRLLMQQHVPSSTETLADWFEGTSQLNVVALTGWNLVEPADPLPAGASVPFTIELATDGTFDQFSAWGPRGIEIQAMSGDALGSVRTTLIWYPTEAPLQTAAELTLLVPLTPTEQEWATAVEQGIPVGEAAAPRLLEVLDAVGPDASLAVDAALLEEEPPGAAPPSAATEEPTTPDPTEPTTSPNTGTSPPQDEPDLQADLVAQLAQSDTRHDVIGLGYADADLTALAAAGGDVLWNDGTTHAAALFEAAGITVENVAWPAGTVSAGALDALADDGADAVVLDADDLLSTEAPGVKATVASAGGELEALLADAELGDALVDTTLTGVEAQQATLALSAVLTRALPQSPSGFLVVLPRDIGDQGLDEISSRIQSLQEAPWLQPANLRSLLGRTDTAGVTLELPDVVESPGAITPGDVADLLDGRALVGGYAEAAGETIVEEYAPVLLTPLSATLSLDPTLRQQLLGAASTSMDQLGSQIHVEAGSNVLLISGAGSMPVTITNHLAMPAQVYVELVPEQTRLQVRQIPQETLPAGETTTVRIPITAVANGNVTVDVRVLPNLDGPDLAEPASFSVRVRADWENIGTGMVAGLLGIAFVIGLIRTIRRGGRRAAAQ